MLKLYARGIEAVTEWTHDEAFALINDGMAEA
jgi:hypothetical protein